MGKYLINEIIADGYERFAVVQNNKGDEQLCVHFLEYEEFIEKQSGTMKKNLGDVLDGKLSIQLVSSSKKVDGTFSYNQKIAKSSHIEAVVEVIQVIAADSAYVLSSIVPEWILVEFENEVDYKVGDRIRVVGSLEINLDNNENMAREYSYIWETDRDRYVLLQDDLGSGIIFVNDCKELMFLLIEDDDINDFVVAKMLECGNKVYKNILELKEALQDIPCENGNVRSHGASNTVRGSE